MDAGFNRKKTAADGLRSEPAIFFGKFDLRIDNGWQSIYNTSIKPVRKSK